MDYTLIIKQMEALIEQWQTMAKVIDGDFWRGQERARAQCAQDLQALIGAAKLGVCGSRRCTSSTSTRPHDIRRAIKVEGP